MKPGLFAILLIALSGCSQTQPTTRVRHWVEALGAADAKLRKEAAFKLGNLGPTDSAVVLPALIGALKDADAQVRCEAILALLKCGPEAREAVAALTEVRGHDADAKVRDYA